MDEFDRLEVGKTYWKLTCVGVRPTVFVCECGNYVHGRSLTHVNNGLRSCCCHGKSKALRTLPEKAASIGFELLTCLMPEIKAKYRYWNVRCLACESVHPMRESSITSNPGRRYGCYKCWRGNRSRPRGMETHGRERLPGKRGRNQSSQEEPTRGQS